MALLFVLTALCVLFGIVYPLCAILFYPIYKFLGGKMKFKKYMEEL